MAAARSPRPTPTVSKPSRQPLTNADIASTLLRLAQLLSAKGENPFKVKAYRRAAESIAAAGESMQELVLRDADLTQLPGIGKGISGAIREIVTSGELATLQALRSEVSPELAAISDYPKLDPNRVLQIYKKLGITSVPELKARLESGELGAKLGARLEQHVRQALVPQHDLLLVDADELAASIRKFLLDHCGVKRVEITGEVRRRVEVVGSLSLVVETADFASVVRKFGRFGGHANLLHQSDHHATFQLSSGPTVKLDGNSGRTWGTALIEATGSDAHLELLQDRNPPWSKLVGVHGMVTSETAAYRKLGLPFIAPELREGRDEIALAGQGKLPELISIEDIAGELHAHSTSSDGAHTIEQMVAGARKRGYKYLGITDHSRSLKIAGGVSTDDLWTQIRVIDQVNASLRGFRILKSAEVDILSDGTLDYPDDLLRELDYTVCSIHSRFALRKQEQTERILRAMDNPYFSILGHATGRLLLKRPGYEIDLPRIIEHARARGCCFEINASPDRLDLSAEHARLVRDAGVKIAICTDAHSVREFDYIRCGIDQARRAGLEKADVLNTRSWPELETLLKSR
ncbi:MAG: PHP domain-containing protein [Opitutus sp.]